MVKNPKYRDAILLMDGKDESMKEVYNEIDVLNLQMEKEGELNDL